MAISVSVATILNFASELLSAVKSLASPVIFAFGIVIFTTWSLRTVGVPLTVIFASVSLILVTD